MNVHAEIEVCWDCVMLIANGDGGDETNQAIVDRWGDLTMHICITDEYDEFSWSQCDGCGSRLGGARQSAVVLCQHPECKAS